MSTKVNEVLGYLTVKHLIWYSYIYKDTLADANIQVASYKDNNNSCPISFSNQIFCTKLFLPLPKRYSL